MVVSSRIDRETFSRYVLQVTVVDLNANEKPLQTVSGTKLTFLLFHIKYFQLSLRLVSQFSPSYCDKNDGGAIIPWTNPDSLRSCFCLRVYPLSFAYELLTQPSGDRHVHRTLLLEG